MYITHFTIIIEYSNKSILRVSVYIDEVILKSSMLPSVPIYYVSTYELVQFFSLITPPDFYGIIILNKEDSFFSSKCKIIIEKRRLCRNIVSYFCIIFYININFISMYYNMYLPTYFNTYFYFVIKF